MFFIQLKKKRKYQFVTSFCLNSKSTHCYLVFLIFLCRSCSSFFPAEYPPHPPSSGVSHRPSAVVNLQSAGGFIQFALLGIPMPGTLLSVPVSSGLRTVGVQIPSVLKAGYRDEGCCLSLRDAPSVV